MSAEPSRLERVAFFLAGGCTVAVFLSNAAMQTLLALAFVALLAARVPLRVPPIWIPLLLFMAGTVTSLAFSGHARAGLPQIRKFYIFLALVVVYSAFRTVRDAWRLALVWGMVAAAAGLNSVYQFVLTWREAQQSGVDFYPYYVANRTTGFMSHWMTFAGEQMIALLLTTAILFFAPPARRAWVVVLTAGIIAFSLLLNQTRSVWLATLTGGIYLIWCWRPRMVLAVPVALVLIFFASPAAIRARVLSIFQPHGELDSNRHRYATTILGREMIRAHPWLGLGPEQVGPNVLRYAPPEIRPLPHGWYGHLHSIYLHYAAERGIPTMLALLAVFAKILYDLRAALQRLTPDERQRRALLHGTIAVVAGILVEGFFELNMGDSEVLLGFLSAVSAGYIAAEQPRA